MKFFTALCVVALAMGLGSAAFAAGPTAQVSWTAPTANVDGSPITGAITYNLYQGPQGAAPSTSVQKGMTGTTTTVLNGLTAGSTQCFAVTAVVATIESPQSAPVCLAIPIPTPGSPTQVTVVLR